MSGIRALSIVTACFCVALITSCASVDPAKVDVELPKTKPKAKITSYSKALIQLGLMTEIFNTPHVKIMMNPIGDETGASGATGAEIPRDITEMVKSALNSIGGRVTYVPYDPAFIQNNIVTGYSQFENKVIPDVVLTGGITEFDRGLVTRGKNTELGAEAKVDLPGDLPKGYVGFDYGSGGKQGLARITLDFNLLDFQTMTGIPLMNATTSMEVTKAISQKELGITIFGASFGRKGSIKKVQGRHDAVRLIVELSVIQIIGKYLKLPYWVLLDEDAQPDEIVIRALKRDFYAMSEPEKISKVQEWLYLKNYDVPINGILDEKTKEALAEVVPTFSKDSTSIDFETYLKVYESVPITEETLARREMLNKMYAQQGGGIGATQVSVSPTVQAVEEAPSVTPQVNEGVEGAPVTAPSTSQEETAPRRKRSSGRGIGRLLKDEEW